MYHLSLIDESRAIARHVFRKHKPELLGAGSLERSAMVDVWMEVEVHQLTPAAGPIVVEYVFSPFLGRACNQAARTSESCGSRASKVPEVYEARLAQRRYLAGDFLSAADLSHFTIMHYFMATEYAAVVEALPHVRAWWEELAARPAERKAGDLSHFTIIDLDRSDRWCGSGSGNRTDRLNEPV
ncbi:hypothetical protein PVAP13_8KG081984 [Panicum virgatum]|uniref:glutathione transferase n=1 Tax=Panicum virgatum TaxID=38727 RepID=A0A8T0PNI7_PANVG|nr:hypothetical protein PVAP13_8KG081984 [Panicum virgatum]